MRLSRRTLKWRGTVQASWLRTGGQGRVAPDRPMSQQADRGWWSVSGRVSRWQLHGTRQSALGLGLQLRLVFAHKAKCPNDSRQAGHREDDADRPGHVRHRPAEKIDTEADDRRPKDGTGGIGEQEAAPV